MSHTLADLLSDLQPNQRREYLKYSEDVQRDISHYSEENGKIPPLRRISILFRPECERPLIRQHGWMAM